MKPFYRSTLMICLALSGCGYDRHHTVRADEGIDVVPNISIARLLSMYDEKVRYVDDDIIVGGYVTANDKSGNIYRSFFIDDGTGALEVRAGGYSLHNVYSRGRFVAVRLDGLTVSRYNGTLQVGLSLNESGVGVGYMDSRAAQQDYLFPASASLTVDPLVLAIWELTADHCGRLVTIPGLRLAGETDTEGEDGGMCGTCALTWAAIDPPQTVSHRFSDRGGEEITVTTSGYANFAGSAVPLETVNLTGILCWGSAGYYLRLRDLEDIRVQVYN